MFSFYTILLIIVLILLWYYYESYNEAMVLLEKYEDSELNDEEKELKKFKEKKEGGALNTLKESVGVVKIIGTFI